MKESVSDAIWFIAQIRQLYRLEEQIRLLDSAERFQIRQVQARPIWEAMKNQAEELKPKLLPRSTLGQAVNYFLNDYDALVGYVKDGRFEIDNNLVENDICPAAVGRKAGSSLVIPMRDGAARSFTRSWAAAGGGG